MDIAALGHISGHSAPSLSLQPISFPLSSRAFLLEAIAKQNKSALLKIEKFS
ncbi:MAG: hypothetical protein O4805_15730 [Trichodesmium sp. St16_bin2-tuft]|jgi:hypothetical protein|nr:hypothetical protein [Trichodesmium sp. MAG_R02]MDE5076418.1 hypothetical protein [Trichodesmium sp. St5_bin2_1]MDE5081285.1 hypothetical protein [Trichodesmium sp. St18_bin1]MDE5088500.1 hypothetical protein [Trichodesmium sp. St16_bin2-tuft]MDE5111137.1 hypothetical protein [Trichodesmium sp. St7_bin2_1]MDE5120886.1 hypothetical protein [Trichodesmium sp. St19_bin1]